MSGVTFKNWEQKKRRFIAHVAGEAAANMDKAAAYAAEQAAANAPVDRGILKSDVTYVVKAHGNVVEGIVGVKKRAFWAWFVELGTVKMPAHPFLRPAVFGNAKKIVKILSGKG